MDDEVEQMRRVAEAARNLRRHQYTILDVLSDSDFARQAFDDRSRELLATLDAEIAVWGELKLQN